MPQYLKHEPSLLSKVADYLVVCVNDFADAHDLEGSEYLYGVMMEMDFR